MWESNQRRGVVWTFQCREAGTGNCVALHGIERIPIMDRLGKSVGKTQDQAEEPCHIDLDSGRRRLEWCIVLKDDVLEECHIRDSDELVSYL